MNYNNNESSINEQIDKFFELNPWNGDNLTTSIITKDLNEDQQTYSLTWHRYTEPKMVFEFFKNISLFSSTTITITIT